MSCPICGGSMIGDGHTTLRHCEFARDEDCDGKEPDAGPVYCVEIVTEKPVPCECVNWCEIDHRVAFLTGHHSRCPKGGNPLEAAYALIKDLANGMDCWASDEDGVHPDAWKAYRKAKALEGVYLPEGGAE